jgi:Fe-Mn family superoxide dismutase
MTYELPALPYAYDALEPHIDARTMEIHHSKHHGGYVKNLNTALEGQAGLQKKAIEDLLSDLNAIPEAIRTTVRNNGGGHYNHSMFWPSMSASGGGEPRGSLASSITKTFGSFDAFKEQFSKAAATRFGSGWAWLVLNGSGQLSVMSTANQDNPVSEGLKPVVGLDVWEHAYYLKYQNRRADYIAAWWNVVNWKSVGEQFERQMG